MTDSLFVPEKFVDHFTNSFKLFQRKIFMSETKEMSEIFLRQNLNYMTLKLESC
jgi:hypothetical protein